MGLPMWREPTSSTSKAQDNPKPDQATRHAQQRSSIRRQNSVRIPNVWRRSLGSPPPPPNPSHRNIPTLPPLFNRSFGEIGPEQEPSRLREPIASPTPPSPIPDPLPSEYRPRARRSLTIEPLNASDELPPLRRMNHRSITDSPAPVDGSDTLSTSADHLRDPAPRRSTSPGGDHWETLLTTITPDPSVPSAESSFASAAASFSRRPRRSSPPLRRERRRALQLGDLAPPSTIMNGPPTPMESQSESGWDRLFASERPDAARNNEDGNGVDESYCPNDATEPASNGGATETRIRAIFDREHAQTYRRLLDHAHSFHHAYEHFDYFLAEFINAHSRRERTQSEAEDVLRAASDSTHMLLEAYDRQQRVGHERTSPETRQRGTNDWQQLFQRVLSDAPNPRQVDGAVSGQSLSSLSNEALDARLQAAAMPENESALSELQALVRERTSRGARRNTSSR